MLPPESLHGDHSIRALNGMWFCHIRPGQSLPAFSQRPNTPRAPSIHGTRPLCGNVRDQGQSWRVSGLSTDSLAVLGLALSSFPGGRHAMTPEQINLITQSFDKMWPIRRNLAVQFYNRFFEMTPDARRLFPNDMERLHLKPMDTIAAIVGAPDNRALLQSSHGFRLMTSVSHRRKNWCPGLVDHDPCEVQSTRHHQINHASHGPAEQPPCAAAGRFHLGPCS